MFLRIRFYYNFFDTKLVFPLLKTEVRCSLKEPKAPEIITSKIIIRYFSQPQACHRVRDCIDDLELLLYDDLKVKFGFLK